MAKRGNSVVMCLCTLNENRSPLVLILKLTTFNISHSKIASPVLNSSWLLNKSAEDSFVQGWPRPKVKYSHIAARRCLNLSLKQ